jgi:hypothetical protein
MSRWSDDADTIERRVWRGLVVAEYHDDVSALDYIRAQNEEHA